MKRSRTAALLLMSSLPLYLTACGDDDTTREGLYTSVESCAAQTGDRATCEQAFAKAKTDAEQNGPRFANREECATTYDWDRCEERRDNTGHSFFGPMMTGFFLSQMLRNGSPMQGFTGGPAFRNSTGQWQQPDPNDRRGSSGTSGYYGGYSGSGSRAMVPVSAVPDRAVTVSRGGFGSSFRGRAGS